MAADRDEVGIAAERRDVVAHPAQRQDLILQREIAALSVVVAKEEPAEIAEPIVQGDDDEAVLASMLRSVDPGSASRSAQESAAMNPDKDRGAPSEVGTPDVQVEAVLGDDRVRGVVVVLGAGNDQGQRIDVLDRDRPRRDGVTG